jgi:hypothetical protein
MKAPGAKGERVGHFLHEKDSNLKTADVSDPPSIAHIYKRNIFMPTARTNRYPLSEGSIATLALPSSITVNADRVIRERTQYQTMRGSGSFENCSRSGRNGCASLHWQ